MFAQTKKKIYIIGSNPKDFYDLTVESIRILSEVELIIILFMELRLRIKQKTLLALVAPQITLTIVCKKFKFL